MTISLPEQPASVFTETIYEFEAGYQPEASEWYATKRYATQRTFILTEVKIVESKDGNYHSVSVRGRPILKSSKLGHFGRETDVTLSPEDDEALYRQHADRHNAGYSVVILAVESHKKIQTIKNIRSLTHLDLKGAVDLVNATAFGPQPLWTSPVTHNVAVEAKALLESSLTTAEVRKV